MSPGLIHYLAVSGALFLIGGRCSDPPQHHRRVRA